MVNKEEIIKKEELDTKQGMHRKGSIREWVLSK